MSLDQYNALPDVGQAITPPAPRYSQPKAEPKSDNKKKGRGGFITSLISELGGTGGALGGAALGSALLPGIGTVIGAGLGGFLGGTGGRLAENKVRDDEYRVGDALKEGAISGIASAGPIKLAKGIAGATKGIATSTGAIEGANKAVGTSILGKLTGNRGVKAGQRLTEQGSGLKADKNVGGIAKLEENAQFMSKYTGTPRQQRVAMEKDMGNLSKQVDDILDKTPTQIDGAMVGQRLKTAMDDLTDERFIDLDLNNPSVAKIIDRYSQKFAQAGGAKGVNDITKTLNKTATRAQNKLLNPAASPLTVQEQAALALKRAADDVLSEIPEIAPLKKQMAQIFEITPQVAAQAERGVGTPFMSGAKLKSPVQAVNNAQSRLGARLQGEAPRVTPSAKNFAGRILASRAIDPNIQPSPPEDTNQAEDMSLSSEGTPDVSNNVQPVQSASPFAPENIQSSVEKILAQGGTMKDVSEFLSNAKALGDVTSTKEKPLSAEATKVLANANSGLTSLKQLEDMISKGGVPKGTLVPGRGLLGGFIGSKTGTNSYDTAARNITDVITRLRTGAALTDSEARFYMSQLPGAFDDPQTIKQKLDTFRDLFSSVANRTGTAGTDLEQSITGL